MPTLKIDYNDDDTTPERIEAMAAELGITPEMLIKRAIDQHLGGYGLNKLPEGVKAADLRELFEARGLVKKQQ